MSWAGWISSVAVGIVCGALAWRLGLRLTARRATRYLRPYQAPENAGRKGE